MKTLTANIVVALCTAAVLHLVYSTIVVFAAQRAYPERIFDVRRFSDGPYGELVGAYLAGQRPNRIDTLFVGSSFTFGYPWSNEVTFPSLYGEATGKRVLNVSIVGANTQSLREDVLSELAQSGMIPGAIVIEFPLINETKHAPQEGMMPATAAFPQETDVEIGAASRSLFDLVVRRPVGLDWIRLLWSPYASSQPEQSISIAPVPDDYFASPADFERKKGELSRRMRSILTMAAGITDEIYLFVTPVFLEGVERAGRDKVSVEHQLRYAQTECQRLAGERCIDTMGFTAEEADYYNLTHLNKKGHADFAALLSRSMSTRR